MTKPMKPIISKRSKELFAQAQRLKEHAREQREAEHQIAQRYKGELIAYVAEALSEGRTYNRSGAAEIGIDYWRLFDGLRYAREATPDQIARAEQAAKLAYQIGNLAEQLKDLKADFFKDAHSNSAFLFLLTNAATLRPQGDRHEDQN